MTAERFKFDRALPTTTTAQPRKLYLVNDQEERDTLPPDPLTEPPPALSLLPSDTMKKLTGYDESMFLHVALAAAADNAHEWREARKHYDPVALIAAARAEFEKAVAAGYEMIRRPVAETLAEVKALAPRVKATEDGLSSLRAEFELLKTRMTEIERRLTTKEGSSVTAAEAANPTG